VALGWLFVGSVISRTRLLRYANLRGILNSASGQVDFSDMSEQDIFEYLDKVERSPGGLSLVQFPQNLEWFNTGRALSVSKELKGKLLLLDFWTYCCVNCLHVLPDLKHLEDRYKLEPFAVIGVHSAKFDNEQDSESIRQAILRLDVTHPVINDSSMKIWSQLGVLAWPTCLIISPRSGKVLARVLGEGHLKELDALISAALRYYAKDLDASPLPIRLERDKDDQATVLTPLKYPGKLTVDPIGERLFISDSANHRLVITDLNGKFIEEVGAGTPSLSDGPFKEAEFRGPQGLTYDPHSNVLYVADTENHCLRQVDLSAQTVQTLAGDGRLGRDFEGGLKGKGAAQQLSSPWDVQLGESEDGRKQVYIAMAGTHQIWSYDVQSQQCIRIAGSGQELNFNGPDLVSSAFAQPSGLSYDPHNHMLFIADSESSTIRAADLHTKRSRTLVGGDSLLPQNLFAYGDADGTGDRSRLQHPMAVLFVDAEMVIVADTYNHKIKLLNPKKNRIQTIAGTGTPGYNDGPGALSRFSEPSGLALCPVTQTVYIADTNNSLIRTLDLATFEVNTLSLSLTGIPAPSPPLRPVTYSFINDRSTVINLETRECSSDSPVTLLLEIQLPHHCQFTDQAPSRWQLFLNGETVPLKTGRLPPSGAVPVSIDVSQPVTVKLEALVYYCRKEGKQLCLVDSVVFLITLEPTQRGGSTDVVLGYAVGEPPS